MGDDECATASQKCRHPTLGLATDLRSSRLPSPSARSLLGHQHSCHRGRLAPASPRRALAPRRRASPSPVRSTVLADRRQSPGRAALLIFISFSFLLSPARPLASLLLRCCRRIGFPAAWETALLYNKEKYKSRSSIKQSHALLGPDPRKQSSGRPQRLVPLRATLFTMMVQPRGLCSFARTASAMTIAVGPPLLFFVELRRWSPPRRCPRRNIGLGG